MIALSKMADHGVTVAVALARAEAAATGSQTATTAAAIAGITELPLPTVAKILKLLVHGGVAVSQRGTKGGYRLASLPQSIAVWQIMVAIDGDFGLTECSQHSSTNGAESPCERSRFCPIRPQWQRVNEVIINSLKTISLSEMMPPVYALPKVLETTKPAYQGSTVQSGFSA
ncbi:MAG: Rrf2 family transcriptional regulator [Alphaproteobacteria bacterium]|nr:Rrf2 family transcriptional regulator [Alphaproteobacteria bacterium]